MQINFTPQKIKAAKAYIENLERFLKEKKKISLFKRIQRFFRFSNN